MTALNGYRPGWEAPPPPTRARHHDPRKYVAVLDHVRALVEDGTLRPGQPVPTLAALMKEFGCARQTAGKALRLLADEGELVRYPGLGYYIAG